MYLRLSLGRHVVQPFDMYAGACGCEYESIQCAYGYIVHVDMVTMRIWCMTTWCACERSVAV